MFYQIRFSLVHSSSRTNARKGASLKMSRYKLTKYSCNNSVTTKRITVKLGEHIGPRNHVFGWSDMQR